MNRLLIISLLFAADVHCCRPSFPKNCFSRSAIEHSSFVFVFGTQTKRNFRDCPSEPSQRRAECENHEARANFLCSISFFLTFIVNQGCENLLVRASFFFQIAFFDSTDLNSDLKTAPYHAIQPHLVLDASILHRTTPVMKIRVAASFSFVRCSLPKRKLIEDFGSRTV